MKNPWFYHAFCFFCAAIAPSALCDSWADQKLAQIRDISENPTLEDIIILCSAAKTAQSNEERKRIKELAIDRLLSIPDFTDKLSKYIAFEKAKWKSGGHPSDYDSARYNLISSLENIPDPRVVNMLGMLLKDMEWTRDPNEHIKSGSDYSITDPNGLMAARSLANLIAESPLAKSPDNYLESDVQSWKIWYEEVRSGEKTFSFKGADRSYRFKPDGTWDTIPIANPPDDGPEAAANTEKDRPLRRPAPAQAEWREASRGISWWWYGIGGAAFLSAFAWFWRRKG